jgi:prephenate dehydratase
VTVARNLGGMPKLAYLGPAGTFSEAALRSYAPMATRLPYATVGAALDAVRSGEATGAVVPLENSVEGAVPATLDELAEGEPLLITGEVLLPVSFALLVRPGTPLADVKRVVTHPHAAAQCRGFLARELPDAEVVNAASTAGAAMSVAEPGSPYDAAVAASITGEHYGLAEAATDIGDRHDTVTRFIVVRAPSPLPQPTGADRTSLVAFIGDDHPGALLEILSEFSVRGVNLTRIESRPTGDGIGRYFFHIDAEGHVADARVGEALTGLRRVCAKVRFLGSYPRADRIAPEIRRGMSDDDFTAAAAWLTRIRTGQV